LAGENIHERYDLHRRDAGIFRHRIGLRTILRSDSLRRNVMNLESILMLVVCVLLMVYLLYALLMPEKF
jgi:K+-transporting ATPase KdpF subunit